VTLTSRHVRGDDHLPECKGSTEPYGDPRFHYCCPECDPGVTPPWEQHCICDRLRACEQRVMSQFVDGIELVSYRRGLKAARESIVDIPPGRYAIHDALAAIDSLHIGSDIPQPSITPGGVQG